MPNPELSQYHDHDTNTVYDYKDARSRERITELEKYPYKIVSVYTMVGGGYTQDHRGYIFDIYHRVNDSYFTRIYDGSCIRCIFPPQTLDYDPDTDLYFSTGVYQEQRIMPVYKDVDQTTPLQWGDVNGFVVDFVFRVSGDTGYFVVLSSPSSVSASNVSYDNTSSGLNSTNVQTAIDEVNANKANFVQTFTEAATRSNIASGENFETILGKIKKFFSDLKAVAFSGNYNDLDYKPTFSAGTGINIRGSGVTGYDWDYEIEFTGDADEVDYDNSHSGLSATNVEQAIDELAAEKADASSLATVATTGDYDDLTNTPTLAPVATSGAYGDLSGTPNLAAVATSGDYNDLTNKLSAGANISISVSNEISATDTKPSNGTYDSSPAAVPLASGSNWQCISNAPIFTAQAGQIWLFQIALEYQGNASGLRGIGLSGSTTTAPTVIFKQQVPAVTTSGTVTNLTLCSFVAPTSTTSYYIWGRQNSGSSLNVTYRYRAIRLL